MLYFLSPSGVHSTFSGVVFRLHLNCERVGRERTRMSKPFHYLSVDGKNDVSFEHSLEDGISKSFPVLRFASFINSVR